MTRDVKVACCEVSWVVAICSNAKCAAASSRDSQTYSTVCSEGDCFNIHDDAWFHGFPPWELGTLSMH